MKHRSLRVAPEVRHDIDRLADFLIEKSPRAAERVSDLLADAVLSLSELSERGRPSHNLNWRELVIGFGKAAYIVQYRVEGDEVFVARIFHSLERR